MKLTIVAIVACAIATVSVEASAKPAPTVTVDRISLGMTDRQVYKILGQVSGLDSRPYHGPVAGVTRYTFSNKPYPNLCFDGNNRVTQIVGQSLRLNGQEVTFDGKSFSNENIHQYTKGKWTIVGHPEVIIRPSLKPNGNVYRYEVANRKGYYSHPY